MIIDRKMIFKVENRKTGFQTDLKLENTSMNMDTMNMGIGSKASINGLEIFLSLETFEDIM